MSAYPLLKERPSEFVGTLKTYLEHLHPNCRIEVNGLETENSMPYLTNPDAMAIAPGPRLESIYSIASLSQSNETRLRRWRETEHAAIEAACTWSLILPARVDSIINARMVIDDNGLSPEHIIYYTLGERLTFVADSDEAIATPTPN